MMAMASQARDTDMAGLEEDILARPLSDGDNVEIDIRSSVEECLSIAEYTSIMIFLTSRKSLLAQLDIESVEFVADSRKSSIKDGVLYIGGNELKSSSIEAIFARLRLAENPGGVGAATSSLEDGEREKMCDQLRAALARRESKRNGSSPRRNFHKIVPAAPTDPGSFGMRLVRLVPKSLVGAFNPSMRECLEEEERTYRENRGAIAGIVIRVLAGDNFIVRPAQSDKNALTFNVFERGGKYAGYSVCVGKQRPAKITVLKVAKGPDGKFQKEDTLFSGSFMDFRQQHGAKLSEIGAPAFDF